MATLRAHNISMSVDGYMAGPHQTVDDPLGVGGEALHEWVFASPRDPIDDEQWRRGEENIGATIMGRNMFGPIRGEWGDGDWMGWWGDNPPYHHDVFVLTHHRRESLTMDGGTTFHFVTEGIGAALERAVAAAEGRDVRLGGGASAIQQYMRAGLLDELHVVIAPVLLGGGERVFEGVDPVALGYECVGTVGSPSVYHVWLARQRP
jgi:dihydrofolate reductase